MSEPFIGEIRLFGFSFAPRGWMFCEGQILQISTNTALFSLLGTTYGGNGQTTFALPDLRGRVPVGSGTGPGLNAIDQGEVFGTENVTLTVSQLPPHAPVAQFTGQSSAGTATISADVATTTTAAMVPPAQGATTYLSATTAKSGLTNVQFNGLFTATAPDNSKASLGGISAQIAVMPQGSVTVSPIGSGFPVNTRNPSLGLRYAIAIQGIFPSRN